MVIVMPKPGYFNIVENEFTFDTLNHLIFSGLRNSTSLTLSIPKFSFESESYNLPSILAGLGMHDAFEIEAADFSGITVQEPLYLGNVYHKGNISVNEWGVEAASGTCATIVTTGEPLEKVMSIDHPFILFIRDRWKNTILFMGRITRL